MSQSTPSGVVERGRGVTGGPGWAASKWTCPEPLIGITFGRVLMKSAVCPTCDATLNPLEIADGYCDACGKQVPAYAVRAAGRAVAFGSAPGARQVSAELDKARKQMSGILFAIAALQLVCGVMLLAIGSRHHRVSGIAVVELAGIAIVFGSLGLWARYRPLPPAIIGLVLYILLSLLTFAANPALAAKGIGIRVLMVMMLIRAIRTCSKAQYPAGQPG